MSRNCSCIVFIVFLFSTHLAQSQNSSKVVCIGTSEVEWLSNIEGKEFAIKRAYEKAKEACMANAFGVVFASELLDNSVNDKGDLSSSVFQHVNAIWAKTLKESKLEFEKDNRKYISYSISGITLKRNANKIPFEISSGVLINNLKLDPTAISSTPYVNSSVNCRSGDNLYLCFKSSIPCFISIYYKSREGYSKIFPISGKYKNCFPLKAHKDYYFFSDKDEYNINTNDIDKTIDDWSYISVSATENVENDALIICYSKVLYDAPLSFNNNVISSNNWDDWYAKAKMKTGDPVFFKTYLINITPIKESSLKSD